MDTEVLSVIAQQLQRIAEALAPASQQTLGFGLQDMNERVALLCSNIEIVSPLGAGC